MQRPRARLARVTGVVVFCLFALLASVLLQRWIGALTVYGEDVEAKRLELHAAILANRPPAGRTWESLGARNTNTRVATVWLAEAMHRLVGISILKAYFVIDTASVWLSLLLLFWLLRQWFEPIYCLVGVLYFISVLPLTYFFYFFHPWDRVSQCLWILIFLCIKREWFVGLAAALAASMVVKYDTLPVPAIYWLASVTRASFVRVTLKAASLSLMAIAILIGLVIAFPGGASALPSMGDAWARALSNIATMAKMKLTYPPLLMHGLPTILAIAGWSGVDRVARAGVVIALACLVPLWFIGSNFQEVRAEVPFTILVLPAALCGLQRILGRSLQATPSIIASQAPRGT